jgi:hypothetical protein
MHSHRTYMVTSTGKGSDAGFWTLHTKRAEAIATAEDLAARFGGRVRVYRRLTTIDGEETSEFLRLIHTARRPA